MLNFFRLMFALNINSLTKQIVFNIQFRNKTILLHQRFLKMSAVCISPYQAQYLNMEAERAE